MYKNNFWYKLGLVLIFVAIAVMSVTFVMMGLGKDGAIIWFFAALPVLTVGCLFTQNVRHKYHQAELRGVEPTPMFNSILTTWNFLKRNLEEKGLFRVLYLSILGLLTAATIIIGIVCGGYAYSRNGFTRAPEYVANLAVYEEYKSLWDTARQNGEDDKANQYYAVMEEYHNANALYRKNAEVYNQKLINTTPWLFAVFSVDIILGVIYLIAFRKR